MAGADASIYSMIRPQATVRLEDPDEIRAKQMTLRNMMQQQEAGALGIQQTRRGMEKEDAFTRLFSGGRTPTESEMYGVDPVRAAAAAKARLEGKKTQSEIDKNSLEGQIKTIERVSSILNTAKDQPSYDMALREIANTFGPNAIEGKPPQFDPMFVQATVAKGQTLAQQLSDKRAQETQAQTVVRDTATNQRGIESNLTTRRGQNMTAGTAAASLAETRAEHGRVAERAKATTAAGKIPPGYRMLPNGNLAAIEGGPADQKIDKLAGDKQKTVDMYVAARDGLLTGLEGAVTGPALGRVPAFREGGQIAEGGVAAMAPVLKQIFRVAGEGTFTDKDQELLLGMVPTRADKPGARAAKMANIDRIVAAKMGVAVPARVTKQDATGKVGGVDPTKLSDAELKRELGIR